MRWLYLLCVFLCSCTRVYWPELHDELTIIYDQKVPASYRAATEAAAQDWNEAAGVDVFVPEDGKHRCHVFVVMDATLAAQHRLGATRPTSVGSCSFIVRMKPEMSLNRIVMMPAHELGHVVLGRGHSEDKSSIMYGGFIAGARTDGNPDGMSDQHITDAEIARLHARMAGHFEAEERDDECTSETGD